VSTQPLIKVLIDINGRNISVQELSEIDGQPALRSNGFFFFLGEVHEVEIDKPSRNGRPSTKGNVWRWSCDGYSGQKPSKKAAMAAMLADCGYESVPSTAVIPPLFDVDA
jgi:hypothetical protein